MKDYLVFGNNEVFIVSAKGAKDAINIIKRQLSLEGIECAVVARSISSYHSEMGKVIKVNDFNDF